MLRGFRFQAARGSEVSRLYLAQGLEDEQLSSECISTGDTIAVVVVVSYSYS